MTYTEQAYNNYPALMEQFNFPSQFSLSSYASIIENSLNHGKVKAFGNELRRENFDINYVKPNSINCLPLIVGLAFSVYDKRVKDIKELSLGVGLLDYYPFHVFGKAVLDRWFSNTQFIDFRNVSSFYKTKYSVALKGKAPKLRDNIVYDDIPVTPQGDLNSIEALFLQCLEYNNVYDFDKEMAARDYKWDIEAFGCDGPIPPELEEKIKSVYEVVK